MLMTILLAVACFALQPGARAVSPAPDGCYPNYTTAEGCNALAVLVLALGMQRWVGIRFFQSIPTASTPVLAPER
jgi:hypothetical protein